MKTMHVNHKGRKQISAFLSKNYAHQFTSLDLWVRAAEYSVIHSFVGGCIEIPRTHSKDGLQKILCLPPSWFDGEKQ